MICTPAIAINMMLVDMDFVLSQVHEGEPQLRWRVRCSHTWWKHMLRIMIPRSSLFAQGPGLQSFPTSTLTEFPCTLRKRKWSVEVSVGSSMNQGPRHGTHGWLWSPQKYEGPPGTPLPRSASSTPWNYLPWRIAGSRSGGELHSNSKKSKEPCSE